jgi:RNA-directed DNA polymerase
LQQLLITPQKEKVIQFLQRCSKLISECRGNNLQQLLMALNPKLKGFVNYYRFVVSKHTYHRITGEIWQKIYRWICKSHPKKSVKWLMRRYLKEYHPLKATKTFQMIQINGMKLYLPMFMPIVRFKKERSGIRVYGGDKEARTYWEKRAYANALNSIYSIQIEKLFLRQKGICPICKRAIIQEQIHVSRYYLGIKINHWIRFFKAVAETSTDVQIEREIENLKLKNYGKKCRIRR